MVAAEDQVTNRKQNISMAAVVLVLLLETCNVKVFSGSPYRVP